MHVMAYVAYVGIGDVGNLVTVYVSSEKLLDQSYINRLTNGGLGCEKSLKNTPIS